MDRHTGRRACAWTVLTCMLLAAPLTFAAPKPPKAAPLRFDPPSAGPAQRSNADYEACIDNPSPDGLLIDCQALLPARTNPAAASSSRAKLRRR